MTAGLAVSRRGLLVPSDPTDSVTLAICIGVDDDRRSIREAIHSFE